jgi:predicted GIY-YIG superfamily endonuclease
MLLTVIPAQAGIQWGLLWLDNSMFTSWQTSATGHSTLASHQIWCKGLGSINEEQVEGFSSKYGVKLLVYFEVHVTAESAISREKQIKKWKRAWKLNLIEQSNPEWKNLYETIIA